MPIPYQFYLEVNNLSLNGWSPITSLWLRLWHIKEVYGYVSNLVWNPNYGLKSKPVYMLLFIFMGGLFFF